MENYKKYTILFIGVLSYMIIITIVYFWFFKSDPQFQIYDTFSSLFR